MVRIRFPPAASQERTVAGGCRDRATNPGSGLSLLGFPDREARLDLFDDLFVGLAEPERREMAGRSGPRCPARVEKDLDRAEVCGRRAVNELGDDRLALGDLPLPTIVGAASLPAGASRVRRNGG